jgi:hypothetical protein
MIYPAEVVFVGVRCCSVVGSKTVLPLAERCFDSDGKKERDGLLSYLWSIVCAMTRNTVNLRRGLQDSLHTITGHTRWNDPRVETMI